MENRVELLFVAIRRGLLQVLYYCPRCESVNEIVYPQELRTLACRECGQVNDASRARIQVSDPPDDSE